MAGFDVETAVLNFLADPTSSSLGLPHMTTGQRKHTKKLVEQYFELRCESYGFGAERQLHLFKNGKTDIHQDVDSAASTKASSSEVEADQGTASPGLASLPAEALQTSRPTPRGLDPSFAATEHQAVQVRNTFIHIDDATPMEKRVIQSMPHSMFRQCILAEIAHKAAESASEEPPEFPTTPSSVHSDDEAEPIFSPSGRLLPFSAGTLVIVEKLVKSPAFNGCSAVVQGYDQATGRYDIVIASASGAIQAKIKEDNLRMILPRP